MLLSKVRISRQVTNTNPCYLAESTYPDKSNQVVKSIQVKLTYATWWSSHNPTNQTKSSQVKLSQHMLLGDVRVHVELELKGLRKRLPAHRARAGAFLDVRAPHVTVMRGV
jgi:hypothetical protein